MPPGNPRRHFVESSAQAVGFTLFGGAAVEGFALIIANGNPSLGLLFCDGRMTRVS